GIGLRTALPRRNDEINQRHPGAADLWTEIGANASYIQNNRVAIQRLSQIVATAAANIPQIQRSYNEVVNALLDNNAALTSIAVAQRQTWLSERLALNLDRIAAGDDQAQLAL